MKIKAKFKGQDSLGYENGKNYNLLFICADKIIIQIYGTAKGLCHYNTLKSFLNNWQVF